MASKDLMDVVSGLENYISANGVTDKVIEVYVNACNNSINEEKDVDYGLTLTKRAKGLIEDFTRQLSGVTIYDLDSYCNANKVSYEILEQWYGLLKLEAPYLFHSYLLYLEKNRVEKDKFYFPKMEQLNKHGLIQAMQDLEDDRLDYLSISMPPGTQKTTLEKFFASWIIGKHPSDYSLFFSHSSDITRMFYDGVLDITTSDEYLWSDIFPDVKLRDTNAKAEKLDFGKYKPFYSLQCTSVGSKNSGKVRCNRYLYCDDLIGGIEEALNKARLDSLWNIYSVDARQRKLNEQVKEIHIATRWSVHDVIGRLKTLYEGSDRVRFIAVPDIDPETGESNFNYKYNGMSAKFFNDQALAMDDISYRCLYKNEPIEREGLLYHEDDLRRYTTLPNREPDAILGVCDTKSKGVDYMVLPCFYQYDDDFYMVDCICDDSSDFGMQHERLSNIIVDHNMQQCEFESNAGGDRLAHEVSQIVDKKGGRCNITTKATETNKETRIIVNSDWIKRHCLFKLKEDYTPKSDYGRFMGQMLSYSVAGKNKNDDVCDCLANFALFVSRKNRIRKTVIMEGFL